MTAPIADTLCVGTLNVWGRWADWPSRLDTLGRCWPSPGPDVVLLQEVRHDRGGDQAAEIAETLGYRYSVTVEGHRADGGGEGLAILSRRALESPHDETLPLSEPGRRVLVARVGLGNSSATAVCGHTVAVPEDVRRAQVSALLTRGGSPLVLGADLNETPHTVAPLLFAAGLRDCLDGASAPTWPMCQVTFGEAWRSRLGRAPHFSLHARRLDYLLSRGLDVIDAGVDELRGRDGRHASDHALVWARYRRAASRGRSPVR